MRWRDYSFELTAFGLALLILCMLFFLSGCAGRTLRPPIDAPPTVRKMTPETTAERSRVESANEEVDRLKGELETAERRADTASAAEREARLAGVRTLVTWLTAICVLVGILSVGAFVFLRMKTLLLVTAACAAMVAAAQASSLLLDHPLIAGLGLTVIVGGVVAAIWWKQLVTHRGLKAAVQVAESLKPEEETDEERNERRIMQAKLVEGAGRGALAAIKSVRGAIAAETGMPA